MPCFKSAGSTGTLQSPLFPALAQGHVLVAGNTSCMRLACALFRQHKRRSPSRAQRVNIPFPTLCNYHQPRSFPSHLRKPLSSSVSSFSGSYLWSLQTK